MLQIAVVKSNAICNASKQCYCCILFLPEYYSQGKDLNFKIAGNQPMFFMCITAIRRQQPVVCPSGCG